MIVSGNTLQTLRLLNSAAKILRQPVSTLIAQSSVNVTVAIQICNSRFPRLSRHWGRRKNINCGQCQRNNRRRYLSHMSSQHAFERKSLPLYPHTVITLSSIAKCCWAMIRWNTSWHWVLLCQNWTLSQESKLDKNELIFGLSTTIPWTGPCLNKSVLMSSRKHSRIFLCHTVFPTWPDGQYFQVVVEWATYGVS